MQNLKHHKVDNFNKVWERIMALSRVKRGVVVMLMVMLIITKVCDATQSQEIEPNDSSFTCHAKCLKSCFGLKKKLGDYILCVKACDKHCGGVSYHP